DVFSKVAELVLRACKESIPNRTIKCLDLDHRGFWHYVVFYNYAQEAVSDIGVSPCEANWRSSSGGLVDVLAVHQPDMVLLLSRRLEKALTRYKMIDALRSATAIPHPAWRRWSYDACLPLVLDGFSKARIARVSIDN
ncbi:MAG: hypothetical protein ACTHLZ_12170, partial [Tepidisphaeraceae bacterium]